jgi:hypothetical protein
VERRNRRLLSNVEEIVFQTVAQKIVGPNNMTFSDYVRALIIKDLDKRQLLPPIAKDALLMGIEHINVEAVA